MSSNNANIATDDPDLTYARDGGADYAGLDLRSEQEKLLSKRSENCGMGGDTIGSLGDHALITAVSCQIEDNRTNRKMDQNEIIRSDK